MRRIASALLAVSVAGGCVTNPSQSNHGGPTASWGKHSVTTVPGVRGPYGEQVALQAQYAQPSDPASARAMFVQQMMAQSVQAQQAQMMAMQRGGMPPQMPMAPGGVMQASGVAMPGMVHPANFGPHSGGMPGMGGGMPPPGGAMMAANNQPRYPSQRTQVRFVRPTGMKVSWFAQGADGKPAFSNVPIETPGRYNFPQGAIYRLKISNIESRPGLEVYPTMEVVPTTAKTESFLAHSAVPIEFTPEDFKQIAEGSYVVKVIYLPDPQFQDVASTGTEEILSTRLEPGIDPIQEALRRGSILVVIRMGNVDQEAPNTPPLSSVNPGQGGPGMMPGMNFGPMYPGSPGTMVPYNMPMGPGGPMGQGGPGMMPQGMGPQGMMMPPPGALPPGLANAPGMPGPRMAPGVPASRPGMATSSSSAPLPLPPLPGESITPPGH